MTSAKLVILGFLRHTITAIGVLLVARGYMTPQERDSWLGPAIQEAMGAVMVGGAYLWSAIDKKQVIGWIRTALHMTPPTPSTADEGKKAARISRLITSPGNVPVGDHK